MRNRNYILVNVFKYNLYYIYRIMVTYEKNKKHILKYQREHKDKYLQYIRDYNAKNKHKLQQRHYEKNVIVFVKKLYKGDEWFYGS